MVEIAPVKLLVEAAQMQTRQRLSRLLALLLAFVPTLLLAGCGALIRRTVDRKFPPVSPERRQLAAIESAEKGLKTLTAPNGYAFVSAADLTNYIRNAVSDPLPLDPIAKNILASPSSLTGANLKFGKQEIAFIGTFTLELAGEQGGMDVSHILVNGKIDVRLHPEIVGPRIECSSDVVILPLGIRAPVRTVCVQRSVGIRLRPAISSARVTKLDFSKSRHGVLFWLERRGILSSVINDALIVFRDNLNGVLHLDVPLPLAPIMVRQNSTATGSGGIIIKPQTLAAILPAITSAVVRVSPKGLMLVSQIRIDVLEPNQLPQPVAPSPLPPETVPDQAGADTIRREYSDLNRGVDEILKKNFGLYEQHETVVNIQKRLLSEAFNKVFGSKSIEISYTGKLEPLGPTSEADRELRLPQQLDLHCDELVNLKCDQKGTCAPFLIEAATDEISRQTGLCNTAGNLVRDASSAVDKACNTGCIVPQACVFGVCTPCLTGLLNPVGCAAAKAILSEKQAAQRSCSAAMGGAKAFLNAPTALAQDFASSIGQKQFYTNVCTYYDRIFNVPECSSLKAAWDVGCGTVQASLNKFAGGKKIGRLDWQVSGVGQDAIRGQVTLTNVRLSQGLDNIQISGVQANATLNVQGWAKLDLEPEFLAICPPPPCTILGPGCRIVLNPITIRIASTGSTLSGTFGISSFHNVETNRDDPAFFIDPDSFDINATLNVAPIGELIRQNALKLPCLFHSVGWTIYALAELISSTGVDLTLPHAVDVQKQRIAWAYMEIKIPVSWRESQGKLALVKTLSMKVRYSLSDSAVFLKADHIPPPAENR